MRLENQKGDPPACVDCDFVRHFVERGIECVHPKCSRFDFVDGRQPVTAKSARTEQGHCGLSGRYFQMRKPPSSVPGFLMFTMIAIVVAGYLTKGWLW